jgi:hypothetical protein
MEQTVHVLSLPIAIAYALALVSGTLGIIQLAGVGAVRATYFRMGYPAKTFRLIGAVELLAACLLAIPNVRPLGVAIAAAVNFIAVALLLKNRKYLLASPGMVVLAALPFVFVY